ncbi:MAG: hypothetical protein ACXVB9_10130 [Bdellovibrionota bacterium]
MIDLAILFLFAVAGSVFLLRRTRLLNKTWILAALPGCALVLLCLYPVIFDFSLSKPCDSGLGREFLASTDSPSYFAWRWLLEAGKPFAIRGANGEESTISPRAHSVPWWYPDTPGDEAELSNGRAFACHAPIGIFTHTAILARIQPGRLYRLASIAGTEVASREHAEALSRQLNPGLAKVVVYSESERETFPVFIGSAEGAVSVSDLFNLRQAGVFFLEPKMGGRSLLFEINDRKAYSPLAILNTNSDSISKLLTGYASVFIQHGPQDKIFAGLGFVSGPRVFRPSPLSAARETLAIAIRMLGLHGHGLLQMLFSVGELPAQWYLLPLKAFWQSDYLYYRFAGLLIALSLGLAFVRLLNRSNRWRKFRWTEPYLLCGLTLLFLLNDSWIVVWF